MTENNKIALLAFVPVIHKGYFDFFSKRDGDVFILGTDLISDYDYLARDLRAINPEHAKLALEAILPGRNVETISKAGLKSLRYDTIVMPDDEICRDLALKYFDGKKIEFDSVFLRWNKVITFKEFEIPANRVITREAFHQEIMKLAFKETEKSGDWWRQIACVVVQDGEVLYSTYNHHLPSDFHLSVNGDPRSNFNPGEHQDIFTSVHAEAEAIAKAANKGVSLAGASLYSTTFPCPNCARLIGTAGVKTV
ncbi:MAG: deaminase, partial [Candidatus Pacebacteria bacterium]|nr:deaminase [Candidatus Paceibacterota bacterium]